MGPKGAPEHPGADFEQENLQKTKKTTKQLEKPKKTNFLYVSTIFFYYSVLNITDFFVVFA